MIHREGVAKESTAVRTVYHLARQDGVVALRVNGPFSLQQDAVAQFFLLNILFVAFVGQVEVSVADRSLDLALFATE
jgi:hypothetical protein